jgi:hypothetical protein
LPVLLSSVLVGCGGGLSPTGTTVPPPTTCSGGASVAHRAVSYQPSATPTSQAIPPQYFGINLHPGVFNGQIPWPTIPFGSVRLWDTETTWNDLNPASGTYDFSKLDTTIDVAVQQGQTDFLYTFGVVPPWASSIPTDQSCVTPQNPAGSCDPPADLCSDGTGPDKYWQNFVTALVAHNTAANFPIHSWEIWNEPDILIEWTGTDAQLERMAQDAYSIIKAADPTAKVTTPTPGNTSNGQTIANWFPGYLSTPGAAALADIVTFHGYVDPALGGSPEQISSTVDIVNSALTGLGSLSSDPLWNTEGSWGADANFPDPDLEAGYLARLYLLQWSLGVSRFYWYQYGNVATGTLWTPTGGLDLAGVAYGQVYNWMVGATLTAPCSPTGTVWICNFTKGSAPEQAVWDTSQTCSNGVCTTSSYAPNSVFAEYVDLAGNTTPVTAGTVPIGVKPILLATQ